MTIQHIVRSGECMTTIAFRYGFADYRTIYDHPDNATLKQNRPNPNVLAPGDVVVVPDRTPRELTLAVDREHRVKVHRPKKELRIVFKNAKGEPLKSEPYVFELQGAEPVEGKSTDGNGMLKEPVPLGARRARVTIHGREIQLELGTLLPASETDDDGVRGAQARLQNLGYNAGEIDGDPGRQTRMAIAMFQHDEGETIDGELADAVRSKLLDVHGM